MRDSFIFYRSFFEAISDLPPKNQLELYQAIAKYSLDSTEKELSKQSNTIWKLVKPQLDANNKRFMDGSKGGRPKAEKITSGFDSEITSGFNSEKPNNNVNNNVNENVFNKNENVKQSKVEQAQPSKNNFIHSIIDVFTYCYKQNRNTNYIITARGKETKAAANILKAFKELHPDLNSEAMLSAITEFFNKALQLNDNFYKDSMSLSFINSQFNQISAKIASNLNDKPTSDTSTRVETKSLNRTVLNNNLPKELKEYVLTPENAERYLKVLENRPIHLIDYFINTNYDKLISMSVHDAAQYFVYYFKGKAEEQANAIRHYRSLLLEDDVKKAVDVIFEASIDLARPYIQSFRRTDSDTWFKEHIRANFIHYQERWQTSKNPEAILKLLKQIKEQQAKPSNVLR